MKNHWIKSLIFISAIGLAGCQTSQSQQTKSPDYLTVANQYAKDGLLREAAQAYRKVLVKDPNNFTAHRTLGIVLLKMGEYAKAREHLEKVISRYSDNFEANFYLAESCRALEIYGDAIFRYKKALELNRSDVRALKALAWSYYKTRQYTETLRALKSLKKLAPNDTQVAIIYTRTLIKVGMHDRALASIQRSIALAKKDDIPYLLSVEGDVFLAQNHCKKAEEAYRNALKEQPLLAGALLGLGRCLMTAGSRPDLALSYMERALRIKPQLTEALYHLGKGYESSDKSKALRYYKRFRKKAGSDPEMLNMLPEVKAAISRLDKGKKPAPAVDRLESNL